MDAKAPFRITGEQIDGAFTFQGEYILEAKWQKDQATLGDLELFRGKVRGKLDNTLGLFVSMNGFQPAALSLRTERSVMFCMDGSDLMAVMEGRIELPELIRRKRQHAARTGEISCARMTLLG